MYGRMKEPIIRVLLNTTNRARDGEREKIIYWICELDVRVCDWRRSEVGDDERDILSSEMITKRRYIKRKKKERREKKKRKKRKRESRFYTKVAS